MKRKILFVGITLFPVLAFAQTLVTNNPNNEKSIAKKEDAAKEKKKTLIPIEVIEKEKSQGTAKFREIKKQGYDIGIEQMQLKGTIEEKIENNKKSIFFFLS